MGTETVGFSRHHSNSRDQVLFRCQRLSQCLTSRMQCLLPPVMEGKLEKDQAGRTWSFAGLSHVWRCTRYTAPADKLSKHFDAVKCEGPACCSTFTLTIYLNTVAEGHGGH